MILRYTEQVQKALNLKTKPEPWLHAAVINDGINGSDGYVTAVFVWDTRKVVETSRLKYESYKRLTQMPRQLLQYAADSHAKLSGSGDEVTAVNAYFKKRYSQMYR